MITKLKDFCTKLLNMSVEDRVNAIDVIQASIDDIPEKIDDTVPDEYVDDLIELVDAYE